MYNYNIKRQLCKRFRSFRMHFIQNFHNIAVWQTPQCFETQSSHDQWKFINFSLKWSKVCPRGYKSCHSDAQEMWGSKPTGFCPAEGFNFATCSRTASTQLPQLLGLSNMNFCKHPMHALSCHAVHAFWSCCTCFFRASYFDCMVLIFTVLALLWRAKPWCLSNSSLYDFSILIALSLACGIDQNITMYWLTQISRVGRGLRQYKASHVITFSHSSCNWASLCACWAFSLDSSWTISCNFLTSSLTCSSSSEKSPLT